MRSIEETLLLAVLSHYGQKDLDGRPAILHPLSVALMGNAESEIILGLLHDVVEDTEVSMEDLSAMGVQPEILAALDLLTHKEGMSYQEYLQSLVSSRNRLALSVKMNDLRHNLSRNDRSTPQKERIFQKHKKALEFLEEAVK